MLNNKDLQQIKELGIAESTVKTQLNSFINGFPPIDLVKPALIGDGIKQYDENDIERFEESFPNHIKGKSIEKFIPASGAASRMFKALFSFISNDKEIESNTPEKIFVDNINKFAFVEDLKEFLNNIGKDLNDLIQQGEYKKIIEYVIEEDGLRYGYLPKGVLKFHVYKNYTRTAIEEHLVEGAVYCKDDNRHVNIHLTVSPEHKEVFENVIKNKKGIYEKKFSVKYNITYSFQKLSTNTLSVDMFNQPFREDDGSILFRPGGHGALLENLNEIDADMIFIKNIDNVAHDSEKPVTYTYKKLLACLFIEYQEKIFNYLHILDKKEVTDKELKEILKFMEKELCIIPAIPVNNLDKKDAIEYAKRKLNRPFRIAGMVSSEGDTGGGPFWAKNSDGTTSLQIVETAQINLDDPKQKEIFSSATHFNPNDLVCGVKDYKGNKFDLKKYIDPDTGFIAKKSKDGRDLKAQELPGLWNGSMSDWNSIFVDVPFATFTPVKMVNDLLEPEHKA